MPKEKMPKEHTCPKCGELPDKTTVGSTWYDEKTMECLHKKDCPYYLDLREGEF